MASLLEIIAAKNPQQAKNKLAELASNTKNAIFNQWQQGEPYRIASGALMMGDPATAKKVIEERFANTTPQDIYSAAQDVGVDFAQNPIAGGLAGIFAGVGAKTADVAKLGLAQEMKAQGIADDVIHAKTGWFSGMPDGKWRFEIPDDASMYRTIQAGNRAGEAVHHPELFAAHPPLKDIKIREFNGTGGSLNPLGVGQINVGVGSTDTHSTVLHELQHAIQQREGFARGGSPDALAKRYRSAQDEYDLMYQTMKENPKRADEIRPILDSLRNEYRDFANPQEAYKRLAGEAEARLTQARMNMTAKQRAESYPPSMFDVPVEQQIVRYGDGTAMSVPAEPDLKDFNGNREAYEKASAEYNMLRMNALDSELKKYGIELQSGGLGSDKPFNYTNAVGGNSAYGYIPGFGEVRFSDHLRTGGMNNTTYNTPDEVMSALRENYKRKLSKVNNFNTVRAQLGLTDDGGKVNFFKIQEWLKNNPQQGEKKDPAYWARAAGLDTTKPGGWSFDYHEPKIPKGLFDE